MNNIKKNILAGLLAFIGALSCIITHANCVRHIANNSNSPWTFKFYTQKGNIYFLNSSCNINGPCIINPHSYIEIEYTHTKGSTTGIVHIMDKNNELRTFCYNALANYCPKIEHRGVTGSVSVNEPASGDFTIESDTW